MIPDAWSLGSTGSATDEFKAIMRRAVAAGQHHAILAAVTEIRAALVREPRDFGEPLRHFRAMHMTVRSAAVRPLYLEFGVHDEQPVVVIRRFRWMSAPDE